MCSNIIRDGDWLIEALDISGKISKEKAIQVENLIWQRLTERSPKLKDLRPNLGAYDDGAQTVTSHPLALTQLLIAYHMLLAREELREERRRLS